MIEKDCLQYARVSEVLSHLSDYSHIDPAVLSNKCRIGTEVHAAIHDSSIGEFPCLNEDTMPYFQSAAKWEKELHVSYHRSEVRYFDQKLLLTGQIDAIVKMNSRNSLHLVDFKTAATESKLVWKLQAHLYYYLVTQNEAFEISPHMMFVKLDRKGKYPNVFIYELEEDILKQSIQLVHSYHEKLQENLHKNAQNEDNLF